MIKLILMAALLFVSGASMAQKVVNVGGAAIIDCRDMPAKAITIKKPQTTNSTTANGLTGTNDLNNLASPESNKTVSQYFEVMKANLDNGAKKNWLASISACADYDDKTWRLPTQREMMLIWTLQVTLKDKVQGYTLLPNAPYWTASESFAGNGPWKVSMPGCVTYNNGSKPDGAVARCIRDLTPPAN